MSARNLWAMAMALGFVVIALGLYIMPLFPAEGAGYAKGYGDPVYAFEMARTPQDLIAVFGTADDPARPARVAAMEKGNAWDYPFMVAYGLFIALFFGAAAKSSGNRTWLIFALLGVVAAGADGIENTILDGITADLEGAPNLAYLTYPVWTKFLSLMVCGVAAGAYIAADASRAWKIAGMVAAISALPIAFAFFSPASFAGMIGNGLTLCWLIKLACVIRQAFFRPAV